MVYLDTSIVISLVQQRPIWGPVVEARMAALRADGHRFAVSDLTRLECFVGPMRTGNAVQLADYQTYFASRAVSVQSLTATVCDLAANIRASYGFKTPDALHLAASVECGCDLLLSHDRRWVRFTGIPVEVLL